MRSARVLAAVLLLAGCDGDASRTEPVPPPVPPATASAGTGWGPSPSQPATTSPATEPPATGGWEVTVYYTAVEDYHSGAPETVTGCPRIDCAHGDEDLGEYKSDFVAAVQQEGTGRTASGDYLNWSHDTGYWLDSRPRDAAGRALRPFVSAAADPQVLARGTRFRIVGCGRQDDGSRAAAEVCAALRAARWTVTDEFTPGLGGDKHVDAYIGEQTGPGFTDSPWYLTLHDATLRTG
ncbi:hypothetical protein [Couchioplanes azureus]|uniref:hypothetical protein n=1 Tax=Couchioplanes caeruleus TaxID=56438 RepID=UPI0016704462|nr:hypothetical protein [Couchioplanes caeruleus]GGQ59796.1 hypothetical protein GCM10010166_31710 [Couchioplanes caeruleus subsp. azureus]